jgi:endonuclease YncB( thermonuclease family)
MGKKRITSLLTGLALPLAMLAPVFAGDSLYGKVTEVKGADLVTFDYGAGQYELRIVGIDVPEELPAASEAIGFLSRMVLGRNVRMGFNHRTQDGEMLARLYTDDPDIGINDVSVELVRAGLVRRKEGFDFRYGELASAEREARSARRGLWNTVQP